jgi:NADH pyrophosphatase NudC (nudix superfamily)
VKVFENARAEINYSFVHEGKPIDKTVTYFLGVCDSTDYKITNHNEIADCSWYPADQALEKVTHQNAKRVLEEVITYIETHESELT